MIWMMSIFHCKLLDLILGGGGGGRGDSLASISGRGSMRPCLPSSLTTCLGRLGEGGG